MSKQKNPPDLSDLLESLKDDVLKSINCIQVGEIVEFDNSNQTVTVRLLIKKVDEIKADGSRVLKERPLLIECPLFILSGGDGYISFDIKNGDSCIVLFNDRDIDNWFYTGQSEAPNTFRMHDLSDGFCLVGVRHLQNKINDYFEGIRLKQSDTNKIEMSDVETKSFVTLLWQIGNMIITGGLQVGGLITSYTGGGGANIIQIDSDVEVLNGKDFTVKGGDVSDDNATTPTMQQMRDLFNNHTHNGSAVPDQQM